MSGPLRGGSNLEVRFERLKRIGNLRLECLKRFYDGRSVWEQYSGHSPSVLHIHMGLEGAGACLRYRSAKNHAHLLGANDEGEMPVFIRVGQTAQQSRPVASFVRLQPLYVCDMSGIETSQESLLLPSLESLWRVFDGKLRAALRLTRVENSESVHEIIEGGSQVIGNLADENANLERDWQMRLATLRMFIGDLLFVEIFGSEISLRLLKSLDLNIEIHQVFFCPFDSLERTTEEMGHGSASTSYELEATEKEADKWGRDYL